MRRREDFEAWSANHYLLGECGTSMEDGEYFHPEMQYAWESWQAAQLRESDLLSALIAITNSGPDAIPIKEAFEMAHRAIERATGGKV